MIAWAAFCYSLYRVELYERLVQLNCETALYDDIKMKINFGYIYSNTMEIHIKS